VVEVQVAKSDPLTVAYPTAVGDAVTFVRESGPPGPPCNSTPLLIMIRGLLPARPKVTGLPAPLVAVKSTVSRGLNVLSRINEAIVSTVAPLAPELCVTLIVSAPPRSLVAEPSCKRPMVSVVVTDAFPTNEKVPPPRLSKPVEVVEPKRLLLLTVVLSSVNVPPLIMI
jgi:hypothetical protein